ncbi:hypothetical protein [Pseudarthrobacter sp. Y6]|uniref:hypothetical protein n=1 Tax=Pseudarthrobacter sp. Y6 TaxID=3418422 RepID=UPI003CEF39BF
MNLGSGWTMGDFSCTLNGKAMSIPFTAGPDADITCAVTNTAKGKIVIVKNVDGADGTFDFNGTRTSGTPAWMMVPSMSPRMRGPAAGGS